MAAPAYPQSESGYWSVKLSKSFTDQGFTYKPGMAITVNEDILKKMLEDKAVAGSPVAA